MDKEKEHSMGERYGRTLAYLFTGGLEYLVDQQGGVFLGISCRSTQGDALVVIRADFEGKRMVGFQGADTAAGAMVRLERALRDTTVKWRPDKYAD